VAPAPPKGWYLAREAGYLAGVSGDRIGQWARRGYIRSSRSDANPRVYSFQDVAEAMAVHELLERGVPHRSIRTAIANLRGRYGDWPLTSAPLATTRLGTGGPASGPEKVVLRERLAGRDLRLDIGRGAGEQVYLLTLEDLQGITTRLRHGGWVLKSLPGVNHIEVDPDRLSGRPTIRNRRIPAEKVALLAGTQEGWQILRADYKLSRREIEDAVRWHEAISRYDAAA
jgi:uncharacterized protein (DUF433 family)/DNA-binding transcriptional MerR regulator